jgi:hypothetical protein
MSNEKNETYVNFKDIVEENGKTIEQNNLTKSHNIPIGSLVEVKTSEWYGKGACIKSHARLFVVGHERDCDGTPLYTLCKRPDPENEFECLSELSNGYLQVKTIEFLAKHFGMYQSCLSEESLTVIERTKEIDDGLGILEWKDGE